MTSARSGRVPRKLGGFTELPDNTEDPPEVGNITLEWI